MYIRPGGCLLCTEDLVTIEKYSTNTNLLSVVTNNKQSHRMELRSAGNVVRPGWLCAALEPHKKLQYQVLRACHEMLAAAFTA